MSLFDRIAQGLQKTQARLWTTISQTFTPERLDDTTWDDLEASLVAADFGLRASEEIIRRVRRQKPRDVDDLRALLREDLVALLSPYARPIVIEGGKPYCILVVGVNGVGKTTTIAKIAHRFTSQGMTVLLGAADTFRAAAAEQLETWAGRTGTEIVRQREGADPAAVAYDTVKAAVTRGSDVVIIDTAGRLHTKANLMDELKKIVRVVRKERDDFPHEVLLVLDATLGQNALVQARTFTRDAGVTGIVMTKLDGTSKGGILANVVTELQLPIRFIGVGERIDDLIPFDAASFAEAVF